MFEMKVQINVHYWEYCKNVGNQNDQLSHHWGQKFVSIFFLGPLDTFSEVYILNTESVGTKLASKASNLRKISLENIHRQKK